eukprot:1194730-Prorocentrum_minimum.AAC.1
MLCVCACIRAVRKLILLDRDGVVNKDLGTWVQSEDDFELLPGAAEAIAMLNRAGHRVALISNQSCVGRGLISADTLESIHAKMHRVSPVPATTPSIYPSAPLCPMASPPTMLRSHTDALLSYMILERDHNRQKGPVVEVRTDGAIQSARVVSSLMSCTYVAEDAPESATERRKPGPGMLLEAMEYFNVGGEDCVFVGDTLSDMQVSNTTHLPEHIGGCHGA